MASLVAGAGLSCAGTWFAGTDFLSRGAIMPGLARNYGNYDYGPGMMNRSRGWTGRGATGGRSGVGMMGGYGWNKARALLQRTEASYRRGNLPQVLKVLDRKGPCPFRSIGLIDDVAEAPVSSSTGNRSLWR